VKTFHFIIIIQIMKTRSQTRNEKIVAKPVAKKVKHPIEKMKTRLQTRNAALAQLESESTVLQNFFVPSEPMIDFDDASACWRANKKHLGNGMFKYIREPMVFSRFAAYAL